MKLIISDIETNRLEKPDKMWLFGGRDHKTGENYQFEPFRGEKERLAAIEWAESVDMWVGHNFISFDAAQCNRMLKPKLIDPTKVIDTLIVSRLVQYDRPTPKGCRSGHSLKAHGIRLGCHKGDFDHFEDFLDYWDEGVEYWKGDIDTTEALFDDFKKYIYDPDWKSAMRVEHDTQIEMERQKYYGFDFDKDSAQNILSSVTERMKTLEEGFAEQFPPKLVVVNELNYLIKKDGEKGVHVVNAEAKYPLTQVEDGKLICYDYKPFKPGSPQDRIDVLWEAGWKPFEKTKTAQKFGRLRVGDGYGKNNVPMTQEFYDEKKKRLETYGWVCNEDNLATLPDDAPQGARDLAQWLTLEGRRSSLVEWIDQVGPDGRIHGNVLHIGAWTGRCSHNSPNTANISAPFHGKVKTAVDQVKNDYDAKMRALWRVPEGSWLVGVDAEGIQLRILGDWLWRHYGERSYADTIVNGVKENETDIHNVNRRALSLEHLTRDHAKTFIYAWVLNAGIPKIASILQTTIPIASLSRDNFESSIKGLKPFKSDLLPYIAKQGYFTGYDGRKVPVPNLHKTLAGILQNGEATVMKHSRIRWTKELRGSGIQIKPVGFIHDEFQTEVVGTREEAEYVAEVQKQSIVDIGVELGFKCPLAGSGDIGKNWAETH